MANNWSEPTAVMSALDYAVFAVSQPEFGQSKVHLVTLIYEGGRWVVEDM